MHTYRRSHHHHHLRCSPILMTSAPGPICAFTAMFGCKRRANRSETRKRRKCGPRLPHRHDTGRTLCNANWPSRTGQTCPGASCNRRRRRRKRKREERALKSRWTASAARQDLRRDGCAQTERQRPYERQIKGLPTVAYAVCADSASRCRCLSVHHLLMFTDCRPASGDQSRKFAGSGA